MSASNDGARFRLENALSAMLGAAYALMRIADSLPEGDNEAVCYLGSQVLDHQQDAHDAFCEIFKLDKYGEHTAAE